MTVRTVTGGELTPEQRRVHRVEHILRRDGGSPGSALEGLAVIVEEELWRKVPRSGLDERPFDSFTEFIQGALRSSRDQILALLRLKHPHEGNAEVHARMEVMRQQVRSLLDAETAQSEAPGRPSKSRGTRITHGGSDTRDRVIARLKREDPELAARVVRGEISANAAAREVGIRKPRILLTSPDSIAAALRKYLSPDELAELARILTDSP